MAKKRIGKQKPEQLAGLTEAWIGLFLALYLLFPGFSGYTRISGDKKYLFYGLIALLLLLGAVLLYRDLRARRSLAPGPAQIAALAFLGFTLLSAILSHPPKGSPWLDADAHEAALTVLCYVLMFWIVSRWGQPTERLFRVLFWTMTAFCVLCLIQALGGNPLGLYPGRLNFYDETAVKRSYAGTIGNVDSISTFLTLPIPMLLLRTRGQKPKQAWPCWLLAAACVGVLFWIRVLSGLVGMALGATVCGIVLCPDGRRKWLLLGLGSAAALGLVLLWLLDPPVKALHELHEILHGRLEDSFGTSRVYIWRQMLEKSSERLLVGIGPDMARNYPLNPFMTPRLELLQNSFEAAGGAPVQFWYPIFAYKSATLTDAHCFPLHIHYCQGLPAQLSWLELVGTVLVHWFKARRDPAAALLGGGVICFFCAMLFSFSSIIVMPFFWLSMALLEARYKKQSG